MDPILLVLGIAIVAMLWMSSRTRKQQRAAQDFRSQLQPGDEVMTGSGLFGTVVAVDEEHDIITLESTPGSRSRWLRAAIAKKVDSPLPADTDEQDDDEDYDDDEYEDEYDDEEYEDDDVADVEVPDDLSSLEPRDDVPPPPFGTPKDPKDPKDS